MELVHGGNLRDLISARADDNNCFTDLEASTIIKGILKAVKYIHMKNIIHRDIKPCIILVILLLI